MKNNKIKFNVLLFRIGCCFLSGIFISMILLGSFDTYSWFTSKVESNISVSAAGKDDILETLEIVTDKCGNTIGIKLKKNPNFNSNPIIYFGVDGFADRFTVHIDPVELTTDEVVTRCIEVNATPKQLSKIKKDQIVTGTLQVYYGNKYIHETIPLQFSKQYIKWNRIGNKVSSLKQYTEGIFEEMMLLADEKSWEEASWGNNSGNETVKVMSLNAPKSMTKSSVFSSFAVKDTSSSVEMVKNPISMLEITDEQNQLLDLVVPKLTEYIGELYSTIEDLVKQLNDKIAESAQLKLDIQDIETQKSELENEKTAIQSEYEQLIVVKDDLTVELEELNEENQGLKDEIDSLEDDNKKLDRKNDNLKDEISELENKINELNARIQELEPGEDEEDLISDNDDDGTVTDDVYGN